MSKDKKCRGPNCTRDVKARGLCNGHYQQEKQGRPLAALQEKSRRGSMTGMKCSFEGCGRDAICRNFCDGHYQQFRAGRELEPLQVQHTRCTIEGCSAVHEARGFCAHHYEKWRRHGSATARTRRDGSSVELDESGALHVVLEGKFGGVMQFDEADRSTVEGHRFWGTKAGYAALKLNGRRTLAHRWLLGLDVDDPHQVDHINGNRLDNRRSNLRVVTFEQQMQNKKPWGETGHRNVTYDANKDLYRVVVTLDGRRHSGGRHKRLEDAIEAAKQLRARLFTHHVEERCVKED